MLSMTWPPYLFFIVSVFPLHSIFCFKNPPFQLHSSMFLLVYPVQKFLNNTIMTMLLTDFFTPANLSCIVM